MKEKNNVLQLNKYPWPEITTASYRYFYDGEKHIDRICNYYVLIFMLENSLYFTEDHKKIELEKGEWYIQKRDLLQQGIVGCPAPVYFYIHFDAEEIKNDSDSQITVMRRGYYDVKLMKPLFEQLDFSIRNKPYDLLTHQSIFLNILRYITSYEKKDLDNQLAKQIIHYLSANYMKEVKCAQLSNEFHFSTEYINRLVKNYCGLSPGQYLQQYRISRAKELLENTDHTLSYIALEVGYHDTTVFYKAFKKSNGLAPGVWRDKSRGL